MQGVPCEQNLVRTGGVWGENGECKKPTTPLKPLLQGDWKLGSLYLNKQETLRLELVAAPRQIDTGSWTHRLEWEGETKTAANTWLPLNVLVRCTCSKKNNSHLKYSVLKVKH